MRTTSRTLFVLGTVLTAVGAPSLEAQQPQQVRVGERTIERRAQRGDSLIDGILTGDVQSVKRIVTNWRERESQLMRELRAVPESDVAARRRLDEQFAIHNREGFAIQSAIQARCIDEGGPRPAGYLGLNLTNVFQVENGEPKALGTTVTSVEPGSPAERAGIQRNDKVLSLAGLDATERTPNVAPQLIPGRMMSVRVEREGTAREFTLTIARRPEGFGDSCDEFERELVPMRLTGPGRIMIEQPGTGRRRVIVEDRENADPRELEGGMMRIVVFGSGAENHTAISFFAGAEFRMLDADWGAVLGVRQGVIVSNVASGSEAARSGLKSGDVVTAVGRSPVAMPMTLVQILGTMPEREAVLSVVRGKKKQSVTLKWSGPER